MLNFPDYYNISIENFELKKYADAGRTVVNQWFVKFPCHIKQTFA